MPDRMRKLELNFMGSGKQKGISRGKGMSENEGKRGGIRRTSLRLGKPVVPCGADVRRTSQSRVRRADRRQHRDAEGGRVSKVKVTT